jgi:hypothetical protein
MVGKYGSRGKTLVNFINFFLGNDHQKHTPKFYFSGSITHKLTFKTKIGKFACILVFFRSCEHKLNFLYGQFFFQKFIDQSKLSPDSKIF